MLEPNILWKLWIKPWAIDKCRKTYLKSASTWLRTHLEEYKKRGVILLPTHASHSRVEQKYL
jgi:hypothetical protein